MRWSRCGAEREDVVEMEAAVELGVTANFARLPLTACLFLLSLVVPCWRQDVSRWWSGWAQSCRLEIR